MLAFAIIHILTSRCHSLVCNAKFRIYRLHIRIYLCTWSWIVLLKLNISQICIIRCNNKNKSNPWVYPVADIKGCIIYIYIVLYCQSVYMHVLINYTHVHIVMSYITIFKRFYQWHAMDPTYPQSHRSLIDTLSGNCSDRKSTSPAAIVQVYTNGWYFLTWKFISTSLFLCVQSSYTSRDDLEYRAYFFIDRWEPKVNSLSDVCSNSYYFCHPRKHCLRIHGLVKIYQNGNFTKFINNIYASFDTFLINPKIT